MILKSPRYILYSRFVIFFFHEAERAVLLEPVMKTFRFRAISSVEIVKVEFFFPENYKTFSMLG